MILGIVLFLNRKKKKKNAIGTGAVPPPQEAAHTLMTDDTLELEPKGGKPAFAVEEDITFVHSDEVI